MIGEQIRMFRLKKGITQMELAEMIGTDSQSICRWEHNRSMTERSLNKVCDALGLEVILREKDG